jgi:hypothetical protein
MYSLISLITGGIGKALENKRSGWLIHSFFRSSTDSFAVKLPLPDVAAAAAGVVIAPVISPLSTLQGNVPSIISTST